MTPDAPAPKTRVLLVALDATTRASAWRRLEDAGYAVEPIADELEALSRIEAPDGRFDVLVLDGDFKHMTGADLADRAERIHPRLPVVWCSNKPKKLPRSSTVARVPTSAVGEKLVETIERAIARARLRRR